MTDLLLTHGYFLAEDLHEQEIMKPYPPLGLLYLSSHLKRHGANVQVLDSTFETFQSWETVLRHTHPPVVGISANLMTRRKALDLIRLSKQHGSRVVVGGPEPDNYAREYLECGADVIVAGEGEETLKELLDTSPNWDLASLSQVPGITFLGEDGQVIRTGARPLIRDLDAQPFPDREAIDLQKYLDIWSKYHGSSSVSLIASRGCPYTCTWCSHGVFGHSYRIRSPENVADELEWIQKRYKPDRVWYADDVFALNRKWFFSYSDELQKRGIVFPFEAISREDRLDEEVIEALAGMGCYRLWVGSESGSQKVLDAMQRRVSAERTREVVAQLKQHGIQTGIFIMLGYEGEEMEDIQATLDHLKQANPDIYLTTRAYPIKGTPFYESVKGEIIQPRNWSESSDRELSIRGRRPGTFYRYANRWIRGETRWHQLRNASPYDIPGLLKSLLNSLIGRIGMRISEYRYQRLRGK